MELDVSTRTFSIAGAPPEEPDFYVGGLSVLDISVGRQMYANILLQNEGTAPGVWRVDWYLDDVYQETDLGDLAAGGYTFAYLTPVITVRGYYVAKAVVTWDGHTVEKTAGFNVS